MDIEQYPEFEKEIADIEQRLFSLKQSGDTTSENITAEIDRLEKKQLKVMEAVYSNLTPWQKVQVARHQNRPHCIDYINMLIQDFQMLSGDRLFAEDAAIVCGMGRFRSHSVVVIGTEKGHDIATRLKHNFGMAKPEGYRKAVRMMQLANRFNLPIISFVDTAGAYPGIEGEERGQAQAIAASIEESFKLKVPFISVIIGEGGSGGAIALATANKVLMLEHAIYSVISPEGCASILWRDGSKASDAAQALSLTAQDLKKLKVIDGIIPEGIGGAHRNRIEVIKTTGDMINSCLEDLLKLPPDQIKLDRETKFLNMTRKK